MGLHERQGDVVRILLEDAVRRLAAAGIDAPRRNAEWLLCEALGMSRAGLYAASWERVDSGAALCFGEMLARRLRREPAQYILGYTEFMGLRMVVTPDVLVPRPETEELVEAALSCLTTDRPPVALDAGTGSGCIALAIRAARPDARVYACDVSEAALAVARRSAAAHGLAVAWIAADMLAEDFLERVPSGFDLLISNPPYVPEEEMAALSEETRDWEPSVALVAPGDPLVFYRRLAQHGLRAIRPGGWLALETHADYGDSVRGLLVAAGYAEVSLRKDMAGRDRIVLGRRAGRMGAGCAVGGMAGEQRFAAHHVCPDSPLAARSPKKGRRERSAMRPEFLSGEVMFGRIMRLKGRL